MEIRSAEHMPSGLGAGFNTSFQTELKQREDQQRVNKDYYCLQKHSQ